MNPNQPIYSVDYLNQIAPQQPKAPKSRRILVIASVVVGILILVLAIAGLGSLAGGSKPSVEQLAARLQTTETIVADAQSKLKSTELRTLNSNLKIYFTNTNRDIALPLANLTINLKKLDKKIIAQESGTDVTTTLEDARLNAVYDRTYAREMAYRLETITVLMQQLYKSTSNQELKLFLDNAYKNLLPTQQQFADFNAANG